jgi:protein-S-isoprenylcysteine O-methyltransferase Ste14
MIFVRALVYFALVLLFFLVAPLLGWGFDDWSGFIFDPPRIGYALAVIVLALFASMQVLTDPEGLPGGVIKHGAKPSPRQTVLRDLRLAVLYLGLAGLPYAARRGLVTFEISENAAWWGTALCALGYGLIYVSGATLGKMYSPNVTLLPNHKLITTGIYARLRHPRYLGHLLALLGLTVLFHCWLGLAAFAIELVIVLVRIRQEEALLHQKFGRAYAEYARHTPRLVPFVY